MDKIKTYKAFDKLLKKHKTNLNRVSQETGIAYSTLSDWKRGAYQPKADKLLKIANYFNLPIDYFLK